MNWADLAEDHDRSLVVPGADTQPVGIPLPFARMSLPISWIEYPTMMSTACKDPLQAMAVRAGAPAEAGSLRDQHSYTEILRSSAWIGGSSVICIAFGVVRTKVLAILLGPTGVGLLGLYGSISDLTRSVAGMGVNSSGVRQIAESVGSGDQGRIARTITVLRRVSVLLGLLGAALLLLISKQASELSFGTNRHRGAVALLSLAVLFGLISDGQAALVQGMRRISDLARMKVWGAIFGCLVSIPIVYFYRENGVVPALIGVAAMSIATSWWYGRKVKIERPSVPAAQATREVAGLLRVGFAFMASSLMMMGVAYFVRVTVLRKLGYEAAGLYQSAWGLAGIYAGLVLQAMGADFYPRLTGIAKDDAACNRMVNEQALVSLLLAGPGILATLTFAPIVITLFYSAKFTPAATLLQWICLGMALRVVVWPIGFIILARGAAKLFFWTEVAWTAAHVGLVLLCVRAFGLNGAGMAFFGSYVLHGFLVYAIVRRLSGFEWSPMNRKTGVLFLCSIGVVFGGMQLLPGVPAVILGVSVCTAAGAYSARALLGLVPSHRVPAPVRRVLAMLRLMPGDESPGAPVALGGLPSDA